ncbi:MAG: sigma-54-dependent Fis family transcriptional regulator [Calditrichae bacterium]|nr:sigma-54-dependent Fis family transcriptional regulator [Calditrichia bacterium]
MKDQKKIVIIEDNDTMRLGMQETLKREQYTIEAFADPQAALQHLHSYPAPLVISDLRMEPLDGMQVLEKVKANNPATEVILISAYGTVETAVKAMHLGAGDFLTKPFSNEELRVRVKNVFDKIAKHSELEKLQQHNLYLNEEISREYPEIIGNSPQMQELFRLIDKVAVEESTIMIEGESGTGKELVARAIHRRSRRAEKPFIRVNCGALNDNLLESELFGHEKGAFTGAIKQRKGRFELADGGTLFLDEIGDISPVLQVKLLRVLQEKEFERVGGEETLSSDVRIICATNRDLAKMVQQQKFREDLFYRLSVIPVKLPPLRERKTDIAELAAYFSKKLSKTNSKRVLSAEALHALQEYSWPGNIRELENFMERLLVISSEETISPETVLRFLGRGISAGNHHFENMALDDALAAFEKNMIVHAMKKASGVKNRAAKILGIGTSALYYKLEKYGLVE